MLYQLASPVAVILLGLLLAVLFSYFSTTTEVAKVYVVVITCLGAYSLLTHYGLRYLVEGGMMKVPSFHNNPEDYTKIHPGSQSRGENVLISAPSAAENNQQA